MPRPPTVSNDTQHMAGPDNEVETAASPEFAFVGIFGGALLVSAAGVEVPALAADLFVDGFKAATLQFVRIPSGPKDADLYAKWPLTLSLQDGVQHAFAIKCAAGGHLVKSGISFLRSPEIHFSVDVFSGNRVVGWAFESGSRSPVELEFREGGRLLGKCTANVSRTDVKEGRKSLSEFVGFEIDLDPPSASGAARLIEVTEATRQSPVATIEIAAPYDTLIEFARTNKLFRDPSAGAALAAAVSKMDAGTEVRHYPPRHNGRPVEDAVDVIIPIYKGAEETIECIESVLAAKNETTHRIILVNDNSPDAEIVRFLEDLDAKPPQDNIGVITLESNGGFAEAVNLGIRCAGRRHVVLLNSDTVVYDGWIDKLYRASSLGENIATVTPFSNNAEIVTVPYTCTSIPVEDPEAGRAVDLAASQVNSGKIADLPVGVGFCMLIRREAIDALGDFDATTWGKGYGEEVDFCLKAASSGWRNVLCGDTFVLHRGGVSFGADKFERVELASNKISVKYPFYDKLIQRFLSHDQSAPLRRRLNIQLIRQHLAPVLELHVSHRFGGGTARYVELLTKQIRRSGKGAVSLSNDMKGTHTLSFDLEDANMDGLFRRVHEENYGPSEVQALLDDIAAFGFEKVHLHSVLGLKPEFVSALTGMAPVDVTVHDYAWICPRVHLSQGGGNYCGAPASDVCDRCISVFPPHSGARPYLGKLGDVAAYRAFMGDILRSARDVYVGADDVSQRLEDKGVSANYTLAPHPEPQPVPAMPRVSARPQSGTIRVGTIGGLSEIKGFHQIVECADAAARGGLPIHFDIFGFTTDDAVFAGRPNVTMHGRYREEQLEDMLAGAGLSFALFANRAPETYSYTLSAAFRLGIWPIVTDIGAIAERVRQHKFGTVIPLDFDGKRINSVIMDLALDPLRGRGDR